MKSFCHTPGYAESVTKIHLAYSSAYYTRFASEINVKSRAEKLPIHNRKHWRIEIMHRDKDVILGEDHFTNRLDNAPQNIFTLLSATRTVLKRLNKSPTRAIEMVQDKRDNAIQLVAEKKFFKLPCLMLLLG